MEPKQDNMPEFRAETVKRVLNRGYLKQERLL
ncbi:hypothetical protein Nhal_1934 [Nitrosococcus halophilus Nc 4]|uniref:Uncharacterized protein n=1 Tax=Nitrosococcus halophilus (strain Nc4) TaxID=472759 RepID=D5C3S0_NITHN|nr:hypothetical protein Nhal_1934 [Nitrosococcus halophilus Nc 4]